MLFTLMTHRSRRSTRSRHVYHLLLSKFCIPAASGLQKRLLRVGTHSKNASSHGDTAGFPQGPPAPSQLAAPALPTAAHQQCRRRSGRNPAGKGSILGLDGLRTQRRLQCISVLFQGKNPACLRTQWPFTGRDVCDGCRCLRAPNAA